MQIFPAARLSRRVYRIVIGYRSMRVKRGKPMANKYLSLPDEVLRALRVVRGYSHAAKQ